MGSLRALVLTVAFTLAIASAAVYSRLHPLSDEFIDHINSKQNSWKAGRNFPPNTPIKHIRGLLGVNPVFNVDSLPIVKHDAELIDSLPENFDPRDKWTQCPTLSEIRDQGSCGSCWALGAVTAMTDRVCIHSDGAKQFHFSAEDLISCCSRCGSGCQGGDPKNAWKYWQTNGLVSGGNYNSSEGCRPYSFPICEHHEPWYIGNSTTGKMTCIDHEKVNTPKCLKACEDGYGLSYKKDKQFGQKVYSIRDGEDHIKAELFKNGPVEGAFLVFTDFFNYKSGVYEYTGGDFVYGHAVKIMGWGVENGIKYWLIANSWNTDWGDKGYFKILRGENHLGVERYIVTGLPRLNN